MCQRVNCRQCGKVTYSGCGQHLDQVFAGVPQAQRCTCAESGSTQPRGALGKLRTWLSPSSGR